MDFWVRPAVRRELDACPKKSAFRPYRRTARLRFWGRPTGGGDTAETAAAKPGLPTAKIEKIVGQRGGAHFLGRFASRVEVTPSPWPSRRSDQRCIADIKAC